MSKEKMTIDELARITKGGFDAVDKRFDMVDKRLDAVDYRLDRIENLLIRAHENRIEKLEDNMRLVKTKLSIR
jgi:hypothetical protein